MLYEKEAGTGQSVPHSVILFHTQDVSLGLEKGGNSDTLHARDEPGIHYAT